MDKRILGGVALVLACGLALGGCDNKSAKVKHKNGKATVTIGNTKVQVKDENSTASIPLPAHMPAYAAVYPGSDVKAVVTMNEEETGTMISYSTPAKPDDIIAFYKKNAKTSALETAHEMRIPGAWTFAAQGKDSDKTITITITSDGGVQSVQEVYK